MGAIYMSSPQYLIAKYIPDLQRVEPRNIGVIIWAPSAVEARFVAEKYDRPGEVDGRSIPPFVTSASAYKQWIRYWRDELQKVEIAPIAGGPKVSQGSRDYLAALQSSSKGNFVLVEGGYLLDEVDADALPAVADQLYATLVEPGALDEPRDPTLDEVCEQLIQEVGLDRDPNFRSRYTVNCRVAEETEEPYEFSHAYENGCLQRLYQRVPFPKKRTLFRKTIHDSAWMFEKVVQANIIQRDQGAALVYANEEQRADPEIERSLRVLGSVTRVLNLNDREAAQNEFASLSALIGH
jgi:hypothetical protein